MAIQTINLTVPGGDTPRSANTKINANFSNATHAASKLVGTAAGNVMQVGAFGLGGTDVPEYPDTTALASLPNGFFKYVSGNESNNNIPPAMSEYVRAGLKIGGRGNGQGSALFSPYYTADNAIVLRTFLYDGNYRDYVLWHSLNTTKDVGTGFLKASSPVLHVYNDKIDKIHEAEQLDITVDKKGVGHYEIHGTTGLRQNDGWNMSPPRDLHGNVRCMIEVTEKDGVITVKTYKRKFDLELAAVVHDYDNPLDIPEGACVELRFNDLPYEAPTDLDKTNL